jgi:hypothetical protein
MCVHLHISKASVHTLIVGKGPPGSPFFLTGVRRKKNKLGQTNRDFGSKICFV